MDWTEKFYNIAFDLLDNELVFPFGIPSFSELFIPWPTRGQKRLVRPLLRRVTISVLMALLQTTIQERVQHHVVLGMTKAWMLADVFSKIGNNGTVNMARLTFRQPPYIHLDRGLYIRQILELYRRAPSFCTTRIRVGQNVGASRENSSNCLL